MRSRPLVQVQVVPRLLTPGGKLRVELRLISRTLTPTDGIDVRFVREEVLGGGDARRVERSVLIERSFGSASLAQGEHRRVVDFAIPAGLAPTFAVASAEISYRVEVRVRIPWWLDAKESYGVKMLSPHEGLGPLAPGVFSSTPAPVPGRLYLEVSLDRTALEAGGTLKGALSASNVDAVRVRGIDANFVADASGESTATAVRAEEYGARILHGAPTDGVPVPFELRLPSSVTPSFRSPLFELTWRLEFVADLEMATNVVFPVPIRVWPRPALSVKKVAVSEAQPVAPVGRERRALVWATVAKEAGLSSDEQGEQISGAAGPVSFAVTMDSGRGASLHMVAVLRWPPLGIGLLIGERRRLSWNRGHNLSDVDARMARFEVESREREQAVAFLGNDLASALVSFARVRLDDEGAQVDALGSGSSADELRPFIESVQGLAKTLRAARVRVPPPRAMRESYLRWLAFASSHGGRLEAGGMCMHGALYEQQRMDILTRWKDRNVDSTALVFEVSPEDRASPAEPARLSRIARELLDELSKKVTSIRLAPGSIEVALPAPLRDPATLEPLLEQLSRLATALRQTDTSGPYR